MNHDESCDEPSLFFFSANLSEFLGNTVAIMKTHTKKNRFLSPGAYESQQQNLLVPEFNGCRVQQAALEYHHPDHLLTRYRCELQYHLLWSEVVVYRTRERSPRVGSSAHSREENHSPDHPRVGHFGRALHSLQ